MYKLKRNSRIQLPIMMCGQQQPQHPQLPQHQSNLHQHLLPQTQGLLHQPQDHRQWLIEEPMAFILSLEKLCIVIIFPTSVNVGSRRKQEMLADMNMEMLRYVRAVLRVGGLNVCISTRLFLAETLFYPRAMLSP